VPFHQRLHVVTIFSMERLVRCSLVASDGNMYGMRKACSSCSGMSHNILDVIGTDNAFLDFFCVQNN
jgi:hypothetical protein